MSELTGLGFRVRFIGPKSEEQDNRMIWVMVILISIVSIWLIWLGYSHPAQVEDTILGNAIAVGGSEERALSNKQLHKMGHPLECFRKTDVEEIRLWIKGDVAKMSITKPKNPPMLYVVTPKFVYVYDNSMENWWVYPPAYQVIIDHKSINELTAADFLASTLNFYNCTVKDFDTELLVFSNVSG